LSLTVKKTPIILIKVAGFLLLYAYLGFWLFKEKGKKIIRTSLLPIEFHIPPLFFTVTTFCLALSIGVILTFHRLHGSLWCDEAIQAECALMGSWLHPYSTGLFYNMRPYSYLMRVIMKTCGFSEFLFRLPSVISYCLFGWFLSLVVFTKKEPWISGIAGVCTMVFFLATPAAIYTASQARGHMPAAVLMALGLWLFILSTYQANTKPFLLLSLCSVSLAVSMVPTSIAAVSAIWLTLITALLLQRPLLNLDDAAWFYTVTGMALGCVFIVYAPATPRLILWMGTNPQWQAFGFNSILPWTNGWIGVGVITLFSCLFYFISRKYFVFLCAIFTIVGIWTLLFVHHHAGFIYAAGIGTTMTLMISLTQKYGIQIKKIKMITILATLILFVSTGLSIKHWLKEQKYFVPKSMAREQILLIDKKDNVLLIGHCTSPRFYLKMRGVYNLIFVNCRHQMDSLLTTKEFDWIILNGSAAGDPQDLVNSNVINPDEYRLFSQPLPGSEKIWVWKRVYQRNPSKMDQIS
jgi:hypothetical protein